ncbi:MAG: HAMP domain-containing histidine kinase [Defluviitaleaceae bacterium]|nr:HAMP domain-containing histidine kinase [Defluviitaleaceae bacterium]
MKSLFLKQLLLYLCILVLCFAGLAAALSQVIRSFFTQRRVDNLVDSGEKIAQALVNLQFGFGGMYNPRELTNQTIIMRQYLDANWFYTDTDFFILGTTETLRGERIPDGGGAMTPLLDGHVMVMRNGDLYGLLPGQAITVGYPVVLSGRTVAVVFVYGSMAELDQTVAGVYRMMLICFLAAGLAAMVMVYFSIGTVTRRLAQMNEAAKVISAGEFDKRIVVRGRDEVGQLAESFNNMAASLSEQEQIRRALISDVSHDLRSPLTSMRGFLTAITDGTLPAEQHARYIGIVLEESERLIKLSNDITDINALRGESPEIIISVTEFDINALVKKTLNIFEARATEKNLSIECRFASAADAVAADEEKIRRVLYNLIDNAVKFTGSGGKIILETTRADGKISVSVADDGPGILPEEQKRVFDRFFKADASRGEDKMGTGLGLSIVQAIIFAHGETVGCTSDAGRGCRFTFTLAPAPQKI